MNKWDVVIPYKKSRTDELRYVLRSLKNIPHGKVFIIGDKPDFVDNVIYIPFKQTIDIASNTLNILNLAVDNADISGSFYWIPDDVFIMNLIDHLGVFHRGTYDRVIGRYTSRGKLNYYIKRMIDTRDKLISLGVDNPLCYELHIPLLIDKSKWIKIREHITPNLNKISMYSNLNNLGGSMMKDVKVRTNDWIPSGDFISTYDGTFNINSAGKLIRETFNEKGQYEK